MREKRLLNKRFSRSLNIKTLDELNPKKLKEEGMKQTKRNRFFCRLFAAGFAAAIQAAAGGAASVPAGGGCRASFGGFSQSLLKAGMREAGWPENFIQRIMQNHLEAVKSLFSPGGGKIQEDLNALSRVFGEEITAKAAALYPYKDAFEAWRLFARSPSVSQYRSLIAARRGVALKGLDVLSQFTAKGEEAAGHLKRPLTVIEGSFIWLAHQVGSDRSAKDRISEARPVADRTSEDRIAGARPATDRLTHGQPVRLSLVSGGSRKNPAGGGNYTPGQLRRKSRILQEGGFSRSERGRLIRNGVTGTVEENVNQTALSSDISVYVPDKTKTDPKGNARFLTPDGNNKKSFRDDLSSMSYAENIRRFRANYDSAFERILRRHVSFNFNGEPFIGYVQTEPGPPLQKLKALFFSRKKLWREPDSYEQAVAEDLLRAAFGKRPFRRITKHDILFPALTGPPIREIYTAAELKKQAALLQAAGYTEKEADHFYTFGVVPPLSLEQKILKEDFPSDDDETLKKFQTAKVLFSIQDEFVFGQETGGPNLGGPNLGGPNLDKPDGGGSASGPAEAGLPEKGSVQKSEEESPFEKGFAGQAAADPLSLNRIKEAVFADQPTVSQWEKDYNLSAPAAKDLWFQIIQELVTERYKRHSFDLTTNEGQKALAAWIEENTI